MAFEATSVTHELSPLEPLEVSISAAINTEQQPRQRAVRACQRCRTRRVRCDNRKPTCSACLRSGVDCIQNQGDPSSAFDPGIRRVLQRIDDLENTLKSFRPLDSISDRFKGLEPIRLSATTEEVLGWRVFHGQFDGSRDLKALLRGSSGSDLRATPASLESDVFESVFVTHLIEQFFRHVHVKNPMLNEARTRQTVIRLSLDGPTWEPTSCLALLVCALGSLASSFEDSNSVDYLPQPPAIAEAYFTAAQRRIGLISGAGGVLEAQCYFYSGVYLMTTLKPLRAWRCFTQGLACCQEFACAKPSHLTSHNTTPSVQKGLPEEECVYWSCWKSERELRVCLDLPDYSVDDLSYPILFPTPPEGMTETQSSSWYFYLSEISLRRLEHRCREEIKNTIGKAAGVLIDLSKSTSTLEELAAQWVDTLPSVMSLETPQEDDDILKFILRGHLLNLWEIIYWPWLDLYINQSVYDFSSKLYGRKALQTAIDRIRINKPGFRHCHHGTWLMLQSCTRSALLLIAARLDNEASHMLPHGWQEAVSDTVELLRFWQYTAADVADRLRILEELIGNIPIE